MLYTPLYINYVIATIYNITTINTYLSINTNLIAGSTCTKRRYSAIAVLATSLDTLSVTTTTIVYSITIGRHLGGVVRLILLTIDSIIPYAIPLLP